MIPLKASLHNHTDKSLLDSTLTVEELITQAKELGFEWVAVTEHGNLHSVIDAYKEGQKHEVKIIPGCEVYETTDMKWKSPESDRYHLLLLAKNNVGYHNLNKIVSEGHMRGFYGKMRVDLETLAHYSEGIICTSACLASRLMRLLVKGFCPCCGLGNNEHKEECTDNTEFEPKWEEAKQEVEKYKFVFGDDFYIELQSHDTYDQMIGNQRILQLAKETNTKWIFTFDSHMIDGSEKTMDIHRKFIAIGRGQEVGETYSGCYQQDTETLYQILGKQISTQDIDRGITYTNELASQCNVQIELNQDLMPHVNVPQQFENETVYLKHLLKKGWQERNIHLLPKAVQHKYKKRLESEMEVLEYLGYQGYFLMLKEIIEGIKKRKIPYGYSRGSGGNCLALYVLGVTEIDSIRWNLDFSRFANKGRKGSSADYDLDISKRDRWKVLEMAEEMFGAENVAHLCTFNSFSPKVAIRDLGKIFHEEGTYDIPYKIRDKISKLIPKDMRIEDALNNSIDLQKWKEKYPLLFEYAEKLQFKPKSVGCHASAIIIASYPLTNFSALMRNKDNRAMLHLEMGNAEDIGLVKMDFLGLNSLDTVADTLQMVGLTWKDIDLATLDLNDQNVFQEIYAKGNTLGIFQMESYVAQNLFKDIKPDNIEDVFAVNAMNRPAILSVGMHNEYIKNKHNPHEIQYLHEDLKLIFERTYGVMLYQEQALEVFGVAGFPEDQRDTARRAIGKKKEEVMKALLNDFTNGLKKRGWSKKQIEAMWHLIYSQSSYSFNLGHACSYALLSYVTAWLKYYYPTEFMCALLISEIGDYEKTSKYIDECRRMEIEVLPPHINYSDSYYTLGNKPKQILFGLESVKGVGEKATEIILQERNEHGHFKSLKDFLERCHVDSTTVISLIKAGAFGQNKLYFLEEYGKTLYQALSYKPVKTIPTKKILNNLGLLESDEDFKNKELCLEKYNAYRLEQHIIKQEEKYRKHMDIFRTKYMNNEEMFEFETLSIFLNGNPFDPYQAYFKPFDTYDDEQDKVLIGGTICSIERKKQKTGGTMAYIELLTLFGMYEGMIFSNQFSEYNDLIEKGSNIVALVKKTGSQFIVSKMKSLDQWIQHISKKENKENSKKSNK